MLYLYLHHVPGRLRLRLAALKGNDPAAARASAAARAIPGVPDVWANGATGSLVIRYDRERLTLADLWAALRESGLVSGPPPSESAAGPSPSAGDGAERFFATFARAVLDRLAQYLASALVSALI
jgi:hypothetical protein